MAVVDTKITDWSETAASNTPTGTTKIVRDLAKQFRNIKSVAKLESVRKHIEQPATLHDNFTKTNDTTFVFTGDVSDVVQPGMMIFGFTAGGALEWMGFVLTVTVSTDTTVVVDWITITGGGSISYFAVGLRRDPPSMTANILTGEHTATDTNPSQSVSFADHAGTSITLPNNHYVLDITGRAWSVNEEEMIVKSITKTTTGFSFEVASTPVASSSKWGWIARTSGWW